MLYGISGAPVPVALNLPYADDVNAACQIVPFPPCLAYAVCWRETVRGYGLAAATIVSGDGGHGLFQLTSWVPPDWATPSRNAYWAILRWLLPSLNHFHDRGVTDVDALMRATADSFNAGVGPIDQRLANGEQIDGATTHANYGTDVAHQVYLLQRGLPPTPFEVSVSL